MTQDVDLADAVIGFVLLPDTELIESICENEKFVSRVGK